MNISAFFDDLRSAYESEIDDLTFDSDGGNVLRQRLAQKRKELGFLLQMMTLSPEMVAVVFHQAFTFKLPAVMDDLVSQEPEDFPEWDSLADAVVLQPWAQSLAAAVLKEPMGDWFMCVAAGLEYVRDKPDTSRRAESEDEDEDEDSDDNLSPQDKEEEREARAREEAGADWMAEQGFDRKD
jgi:hypothetical protein